MPPRGLRIALRRRGLRRFAPLLFSRCGRSQVGQDAAIRSRSTAVRFRRLLSQVSRISSTLSGRRNTTPPCWGLSELFL